MKLSALALIAAVVTFAAMPSVRAADEDDTDYIAGMDDLPLMPGLKINPAASTDFEQPEGRIVEVTANGVVDAGRVADYYAKTLPQLGWTQTSASRYVRENERLDIQAQPSGMGATVHFTVEPAAAAAR